MFLIYTDETGKDLKKGKDGIYRDGPFFIYGGLAFPETKVSVVEVAFKELCKELLQISPLKEEIHTGDIFYKKKAYSEITETKANEFFCEVFQLLRKFNIPLIAGIVYKDSSIFNDNLRKISSAIYSFFSSLDYFLLSKNAIGIIVADELGEGNPPKPIELTDERKLIGKKGGIKLSWLLRRILYERSFKTKELEIPPLIFLKYRYESQLYSLIENTFYISSHSSTLNQLSDIVLFILNIALESFFIKQKKRELKEVIRRKSDFIDNIKDTFFGYLKSSNSTLGFLKLHLDRKHYDCEIIQPQELKAGFIESTKILSGAGEGFFNQLIEIILEMQTKGT